MEAYRFWLLAHTVQNLSLNASSATTSGLGWMGWPRASLAPSIARPGSGAIGGGGGGGGTAFGTAC